ncbi:MAG: Swt1 family HEPN domain-containing protein [Bacillota bacterium]
MSISNRERIGRGLDALQRGLAPYVKRELQARFGKDWWREGVLLALSGTAGAEDALRLNSLPENDRVAQLDVYSILLVLWNNWNEVFQAKLGHTGRSFVSELREVRNRWAHQQPFTVDDTYRALDTMTRLLQGVVAEEAAEVERLARELLRLRFESEMKREVKKGSQIVTETGTTAGLKPWREVITPHPDVASGRYQQAEFAADLAKVVSNEADEEYSDPREFFRRTYLTEGIADLLVAAIHRLAGTGGEPVVQLQTSFGGGKTHTMLALYHLFGGSLQAAEVPGLERILLAAGIERLPVAKRAVVTGVAFSPTKPRRKPEGIETKTFWGEIAYQLGKEEGYSLVAADDERGVSPGSDVLKELFDRFGPALVLIDEWVAFARQLYNLSEVLPAGSFDANMSFAQALTEGAKRAKNALVVVSIPESDIEVGGEGGRATLQRLQKTVERVESPWKPAGQDESFEIVRRRLFMPEIDYAARDAVVSAFAQMYRSQKGEFPRECATSTYEDRLRTAYPIHPELFDRLYQDWSTLERFQRTRGVLRLMAAVIHELWERQDRSLMIMPGTLPLDAHSVCVQLTRNLPEPDSWPPVLDTDIDGPQSRPLILDRENPNLGRFSACRRVSRTVFMGSAPAAAPAGSTPRLRGVEEVRVKLGCVQPGETPHTFGDALRRLGEQLTYLYADGSRYWFDTRPSVNRMAAERAERLPGDEIEAEILERLKKEKDRGDLAGAHVSTSPAGGDVPDEQAARLVMLPPGHPHRSGADDSPALEMARGILEKRGSAPRIYQNTLVFLAADKNRVLDLETSVRHFLAWRSIKEDKEHLNLDAFQSRQVDKRFEDAETTLRSRLFEAYSWLLIPSQTVTKQEILPVQWEAARLTGNGASLTLRASKKLSNLGHIHVKWSPILLKKELDDHLWKEQDHIEVTQLWEYLTRYLYLSRLRDEKVLLDTIQEGITTAEYFGYASGIDEKGRYAGLQFNTGLKTSSVSLSGLLVKPETALAQITAAKEAESAQPVSGITGGVTYITPPPAGVRTAENGATATPPVFIRRPRRFHGTITLDVSRVGRDAGRIAEEVVQHLTTLAGAKVEVTLEIDARVPDGVSEEIQRIVTENCRTLKFKSHGFEDE